MAAEPIGESQGNDYKAHNRDYSAFLKMVKWGAISCFIIGAIVVLIISN